ncbi:MAG TPA: nicotinate phosphoribosyltransferase [Vicinamibacteria bacterium]|nr:nicotinate phosphoribosyltransferase [Vicinamibacteria bacterium]
MPVVQSLLDVDFYKFTMGQLVFLRYRDVPVTYSLTNRTRRVRLAEIVDRAELREELDHVRSLRFNNSELHYLRGTNEYGDRMFAEDYLEFLRDFKLPEYELEVVDGSFRLRFRGRWSETIYWETIGLAIVNELYYRNLMKDMSRFEKDLVDARGKLRLSRKIEVLREHPEVKFVDFGTRRRFSRSWQHYVDRTLAEEMPAQFLGTSSTESAMLHGLVPMGTSAHELYMVMSGIMHESDDRIHDSHNRVLEDWWDLYGWGLSIALTDTYGADFFFRDMTEAQARAWKGLRHDSGDPFEFGEKAIRFYRDIGIDPREKLLIFSDGLELETILALSQRFHGRIKLSFGWGTNLTNDLGFEPISIVVKAVEANGHRTVKLSDNLAKSTGTKEDIERFRRIFGHQHEHARAVRY